MAGAYGADVAQLRELAQRFDQLGDKLDTTRMTVGTQIQISAWVGPVAVRFRHSWDSEYSRQVSAAARLLRDSARNLRKNADEQDQASRVTDALGGAGTGRANGIGAFITALLTNRALIVAEDIFDRIGKVDALDTFTQLRLLKSFGSFDEAFLFNKFAGGLHVLDNFLDGENWASVTQRLSWMLGDGSLAGKVGSAADVVGKVGKFLGPASVVFGVLSVGSDIAQKKTGRAVYDGVSTGLVMAAMATPPPADAILGVAAGGMALGSLAYDNVPVFHDFVDHSATEVSAVANVAGKAAGEAAHEAGNALAHGTVVAAHNAEDFTKSVVENARKVWPF